jgi:glyoxylase-like metal-dependent hydrolase (beta-lactamase superfamily II)
MKQLADGLYLLRGFPPNAINVYLAQDVLIDAGTRQAEGRIVRQIRGRSVTAHALTHAHPDHQGASHAICQRLEIPLWCGHGDVPVMQTPGGISSQPGVRLDQPPPDAFLDGSVAPGRAGAEGGRRGRRLHRAGGSRSLARTRRLLARVRSRADPRRRAQRDEPNHGHPRAAGATGGVHPPAALIVSAF